MKLFDWFRGKPSSVEPVTRTPAVDVRLKCRKCGGTKFKAPSVGVTAESRLTCAQCGTAVDLAIETRRIEAEVRQAIERRAR